MDSATLREKLLQGRRDLAGYTALLAEREERVAKLKANIEDLKRRKEAEAQHIQELEKLLQNALEREEKAVLEELKAIQKNKALWQESTEG